MITYEIINSSLSAVEVMDEDLVLLEIEEVIEQFGLTVTVDIHNNRKAQWNEEMIQPFSESLAFQFKGQVEIKVD